jgi:molecular chaperone GrpE
MNDKDWKKFKEETHQEEVQDEVIEPTESEAHVLDHPSYLELEEKLTSAEQQAHENWEKAVRATAELENERRRGDQKLTNALKYGSEKLLQDFIPIVDSLEHALNAADETTAIHMKEGIALTMKLFLDVLARHNVTQVNPVGELFNPQFHEAMSTQISAEVAPNTVLTVFQKGYLLNDRMIRPARVIVAKA